jgi:hypothetical protein
MALIPLARSRRSTQDDNTVQALYELYRTRKEKVLRSWPEVRRILEKEVLPRSGRESPCDSTLSGFSSEG